MEEPLLTSGFNKGFSEVGDLHLEDLTTIHSPWGLVIQLDLLATSSNLQAEASAITLSLGEGLVHCSTDLFTSALQSAVGLGMLSGRAGLV